MPENYSGPQAHSRPPAALPRVVHHISLINLPDCFCLKDLGPQYNRIIILPYKQFFRSERCWFE